MLGLMLHLRNINFFLHNVILYNAEFLYLPMFNDKESNELKGNHQLLKWLKPSVNEY